MERRSLLNWITAAGAVGLAGCSGITGETNEQANPYNQDTETPDPVIEQGENGFRVYFEDDFGHDQLGQAPAEAEERQIVRSALQDFEKFEEWDSLNKDDYIKAQLALQEGITPLAPGLPGSVERIGNRTREIFPQIPDNPENYNGEFEDINERHLENVEDKAEIYTLALRSAVKEVTDQANSVAANVLNTNLAEHVLEDYMDIDIPGYQFSTLNTDKPINARGGVSVAEEGEETYLSHPIGILQYVDEGEQQVREFEVETQFYPEFSKPENSFYKWPLDEDFPPAYSSRQWEPEQFMHAFCGEKARKLVQMDEIPRDEMDRYLIEGLLSQIDDAPELYNFDEDRATGGQRQVNGDYEGVAVSSSFRNSVSHYMDNPTRVGKKKLDGASKAIFSSLNKFGWNKAIALDGTIDTPEIYRISEEFRKKLHANQVYNNFGQRISAE